MLLSNDARARHALLTALRHWGPPPETIRLMPQDSPAFLCATALSRNG